MSMIAKRVMIKNFDNWESGYIWDGSPPDPNCIWPGRYCVYRLNRRGQVICDAYVAKKIRVLSKKDESFEPETPDMSYEEKMRIKYRDYNAGTTIAKMMRAQAQCRY